ncbi:MAG: hypothetical protein JSW40_04845, partial [Candidatus Omnitrophota bacterium]
VKSIGRFFHSLIKIYLSSEYRKKIARERIEKWIYIAELKHKSITKKEAYMLREELKNADILGILELGPLWTAAKIIKPPFIGTVANLTLFSLFITTRNPSFLIPLFADGIIRFIIAAIFTGFKYRILLALSLIPSFGFVIPIPAQLMRSFPHISEFLMCEVLGAKLGMFLPGIERHSFRTYFYMRLMKV